ncbi:mycothiol transferase [Nocardioides pelophilus]|uniref:mycothiol transferase n=1 Tax=Nocardioides pelophilus TaxID=2172019 RepID=UPI0028ACEA9C|nr:DUF664 domain-containing protein [Nocardioides pelophilus]
MSEDNRMARNSEEPPKTGPVGAERWADYLDWVRSELIRGVLGLTPDQQRLAQVPSAWTPLELLNHVLHMEQRWFVWGFLGEPVADPWGDWDVAEPWADGVDGRWRVPDGVTAAAIADRVGANGARTREVLASYPLDTVGSTGGRFSSDPPTLEWICFHVLAEYARHAGHLDIVVELGG